MTDRERLVGVGINRVWGGLTGTPYVDDAIRWVIEDHKKREAEKKVEKGTRDSFQVGDRVWSSVNGWGKVISISTYDGERYPVGVKTDAGHIKSYTLNGCELEGQLRCLFFEEIPVPETATIRKKWRAERGTMYWFVNVFGEAELTDECGWDSDTKRWEIGNYFKDKKEAMSSDIYKGYRGGSK